MFLRGYNSLNNESTTPNVEHLVLRSGHGLSPGHALPLDELFINGGKFVQERSDLGFVQHWEQMFVSHHWISSENFLTLDSLGTLASWEGGSVGKVPAVQA